MAQDAGIELDYDDPKAWDAELARLQAETDIPETEDGQVVSGTVIGTAGDESTVEFMGERFRIASKIGLMPLLKFSAHSDMKTTDPRALGAMYAMLRDCIHPGSPGCGECKWCAPQRCGECRGCERAEDGDPADLETDPCLTATPDETRCAQYDEGDWRAFEDHAIETKAEAEDLLDVISHTIELISGRPTEPASPSSTGRRAISGKSTARSSARRARGSKR